MPVKFLQTSVRFWFLLSYLITTVWIKKTFIFIEKRSLIIQQQPIFIALGIYHDGPQPWTLTNLLYHHNSTEHQLENLNEETV